MNKAIDIFVALVVWAVLNAGCGASHFEMLRDVSRPWDAAESGYAPPDPEPESRGLTATDRVAVETTYGTIVVELYGNDAPVTVDNFLQYVDSGFYAGKIIHRVIPGFMIQGGGYDATFEKGRTSSTIPLELIPRLRHQPGTLSMARTTDVYSVTSQFFICVNDVEQLNGEYAAFGRVVEGYDVVLAISGVKTDSVETDFGVLGDVPRTPVVIESVTRL